MGIEVRTIELVDQNTEEIAQALQIEYEEIENIRARVIAEHILPVESGDPAYGTPAEFCLFLVTQTPEV